MTRPTAPSRWLRAVVLGLCAVGLAAAGHLAGGGHAEPVFVGLLMAAAVVGGYRWLDRERGVAWITAVVLGTQVVVHVVLTVGHEHAMSKGMLVAHAAAAVALGAFLSFGEARLHAVARRRFLQWLVAVRVALAGVPALLPARACSTPGPGRLFSVWTHGLADGRGPPVGHAA